MDPRRGAVSRDAAMAAITYESGTVTTGLGKLVRLVRDVHARRLQFRETMTKDIAEDIMRVLETKGVLVITKANIYSMCSRGPNDDTAQTVVVYGCGTLKDPAVREQTCELRTREFRG
jgi:GTP cyclohydrolase I